MENNDWPDYNDNDWGDFDGGDGWSPTKPRRRPGWIFAVLVLVVLLAAAFVWRARGRSEQTIASSTNGPVAAAVQSTEATATPTATATPSPTVTSVPVASPSATLAPTALPTATMAPIPAAALQQQMLQLINQARMEAGVPTVMWDPLAAEVGRLHAEDMVARRYFSHWNPEGLGPEHRYAVGGGRHAVAENLHARLQVSVTGRGAPVEDWALLIEEAHVGLMDSQGHRQTILDPANTHVGIGIAFDEFAGQFRLAQEFTRQYVILAERLPLEQPLGASVSIEGVIPGEEISNVLLDLAYEPFPTALSAEQLEQTSTYRSAAESIETRRLQPVFNEEVVLNIQNQPGIYHIRIFGNLRGVQALLLNQPIWVGAPP